MKYLIKNGRVIDPANKIDEALDISISGDKVENIGRSLKIDGHEVIDARGSIVAPGLVDMHTHLREPGREDEETISSGTRAAVRGGFTSVACMPNTEPSLDTASVIKQLKGLIAKEGRCNVFIIGAITEGRTGKALTDFDAMKKEGVVGVSDDGASIASEKIMVEALRAAESNGLILIEHCEDIKVSAGGVVNEGFISTKTGLRPIPARSEYEIVKRNIDIAGRSGLKIHLAHISSAESVKIIRKAKKEGVKVTAETAPHYFTLTDECCVTYDTNTKMNPPLRSTGDIEEIKAGLADGTIDVIATDHAPHTDAEKDVEFDFAPFGIIGLETALSLGVSELVDKKVLTWSGLISKMSAEPAAILNIPRGNLKKGNVADMIIINPSAEYVYKRDSIESRSKNSPFIDWKLKARVSHVFVSGKLVMKNELIVR